MRVYQPAVSGHSRLPFKGGSKTKVSATIDGAPTEDVFTLSSRKTTTVSPSLLQRLRGKLSRMAIYVATGLSLLGPASGLTQTSRQLEEPIKTELVITQDATPSENTYQLSGLDLEVTRDSLEQGLPSVFPSDTTELKTPASKEAAELFASPQSGGGQSFLVVVKPSVESFAPSGEWFTSNGSKVQQGPFVKISYEGQVEVTEAGADFASNKAEIELGVERRYATSVGDNIKLSHRYFAGTRFQNKFEGSDQSFSGMLRTRQELTQDEAFKVFGEEFGWELDARESLLAHLSRDTPIEGVFQLRTLVAKKFDLDVFGKKRVIQLKVGPEFRYSTKKGTDVVPAVRIKLKF